MYLLEMFGISLILTLILELPVASLMGIRGREHLLLVILVNILTNPAAVLACRLGAAEPVVELAVFAVEAWIYRWFSKDERWNIPHPVRLSAAANGLSWLTGMVIGGLL